MKRERGSLWRLVFAPTVWALHFLLCYVIAAGVCAKRPGDAQAFFEVRVAIATITALALIAIALHGRSCLRRYRAAASAPAEHADRQRFLGYAGLILSALSAVAVLYVAAPAFIIDSCR